MIFRTIRNKNIHDNFSFTTTYGELNTVYERRNK